MSDTTVNPPKQSPNPLDTFIVGARKGFNVAVMNLIPNVLMAYVLAQVLDLLGVLAFFREYCSGVMGIFGLPGDAITVLVATWLSCSAGVGMAASLYSQGLITPEHVTILMPALLLMASQIQYMGRLLGVADCPKRYWPLLMFNSIFMASIGMLIVRFLV